MMRNLEAFPPMCELNNIVTACNCYHCRHICLFCALEEPFDANACVKQNDNSPEIGFGSQHSKWQALYFERSGWQYIMVLDIAPLYFEA
jgi:hypothetical protein